MPVGVVNTKRWPRDLVLVFLSYQTDDRRIAAEVGKFFEQCGCEIFMAHEHIDVSQEWQDAILEKLEEAEIFIAILTTKYVASHFCLQESGIAVFCEEDLTIIPLHVDGTLPPGFMKHIQARRYVPGADNDAVLFAGLANFDVRYAIDVSVNRLGSSRSWAVATKWFGLLRPYLKHATPNQKVDILQAAAGNSQFAEAGGCRDGLIELFEKHGHRLSSSNQAYLERVFG